MAVQRFNLVWPHEAGWDDFVKRFVESFFQEGFAVLNMGNLLPPSLTDLMNLMGLGLMKQPADTLRQYFNPANCGQDGVVLTPEQHPGQPHGDRKRYGHFRPNSDYYPEIVEGFKETWNRSYPPMKPVFAGTYLRRGEEVVKQVILRAIETYFDLEFGTLSRLIDTGHNSCYSLIRINYVPGAGESDLPDGVEGSHSHQDTSGITIIDFQPGLYTQPEGPDGKKVPVEGERGDYVVNIGRTFAALWYTLTHRRDFTATWHGVMGNTGERLSIALFMHFLWWIELAEHPIFNPLGLPTIKAFCEHDFNIREVGDNLSEADES